MADYYVKLSGKLDRRSPRDEGKPEDVVVRENFLSRDGKNTKVQGTTRWSQKFEDRVIWGARYYSDETGIENPKTFAYTRNGKLWFVDNETGAVSVLRDDLNPDAFPQSWSFKQGNLTLMFLVDGRDLWVHNGNNSNVWDKVDFKDAEGNPNNPIDVIEHRDRLIVISRDYMFISKNLYPEIFDDPTDSIQLIVGSGKAKNLALGKIEDNLFILTTEGIYRLIGDTISAVAETFAIELIEEKRIMSSRASCRVEKSIMFLGDDLELWSFNGIDAQLMSYSEKISDYINDKREYLDKAVAHYDEFNKYFMLSVVEKGETENNIEFLYDTLGKQIDIIRGRNVSFYLTSDTTREEHFLQLGRSDDNFIMWANRERNFDGVPIPLKLRSKDITPKKGYNVRFGAFYPDIEPTGERDMFFRYLLDGRLSDLDHTADWKTVLSGDAKILGYIRINNQNQAIDRVRPKVNYSRGTSVCFEIYDNTPDMECVIKGIGMDIIAKGKKKGKLIGK